MFFQPLELHQVPHEIRIITFSRMRTTAFCRMRRTCKEVNGFIEKCNTKLRNTVEVYQVHIDQSTDGFDYRRDVKVTSNKLNNHVLPYNFHPEDLRGVRIQCLSISSESARGHQPGEEIFTFLKGATCRELDFNASSEEHFLRLVQTARPSIVKCSWDGQPSSNFLGNPALKGIEEIVFTGALAHLDFSLSPEGIQYLSVTMTSGCSDDAIGELKKKMILRESKLKRVYLELLANPAVNPNEKLEEFGEKSILTYDTGRQVYMRMKRTEKRHELQETAARIQKKPSEHMRCEDYDTDDEFDKSLHSHYTHSDDSFNLSSCSGEGSHDMSW